jgi:hypothetical protein
MMPSACRHASDWSTPPWPCLLQAQSLAQLQATYEWLFFGTISSAAPFPFIKPLDESQYSY